MSSRCHAGPGNSASKAPKPDAEPFPNTGPAYTWLDGYDGKGSKCTGDFEMEGTEKETKAFVYQQGVFEDCPDDVETFHLKFEDYSDHGSRCWELPTGEMHLGEEEKDCADHLLVRRWGLKLVPKTPYYTHPCKSAVIAFWDPRPEAGGQKGCGHWIYVAETWDCANDLEENLSRDEREDLSPFSIPIPVDENAEFMSKVYVLQRGEDEESAEGADCINQIGVTDFSEHGCPYKLLSSASAKKKGDCS